MQYNRLKSLSFSYSATRSKFTPFLLVFTPNGFFDTVCGFGLGMTRIRPWRPCFKFDKNNRIRIRNPDITRIFACSFQMIIEWISFNNPLITFWYLPLLPRFKKRKFRKNYCLKIWIKKGDLHSSALQKFIDIYACQHYFWLHLTVRKRKEKTLSLIYTF